LVTPVAAPDHEIAAAAIDLKLASRTWLGLQGELLRSKVDRSDRRLDFFFADPFRTSLPPAHRRKLRYKERSARLCAESACLRRVVLGAIYKLLLRNWSVVSPPFRHLSPAASWQLDEGQLQPDAPVRFIYNHASGFFAAS